MRCRSIGGSGPRRGPPGSRTPIRWSTTLEALRRRGFGRLLVERPRRDARGRARRSSSCCATRRRSRVIVDRLQSGAGRARAADRFDRDGVSRRRRRGVRHRSGRRGRAGDDAPLQRALRVPRRAASRTRFRSRGCSRSTTRSAPARRVTASATSSSSTWSSSCPIRRKSINDGAIEPWTKPHYRSCLVQLKRAAQSAAIRLDVPWRDLSRRRAAVRHRRGDGEYEGVAGILPPARAQEIQGARPRVPQPLSRLPDVPASAAARGCGARRATSASAAGRSTPSAR